MAEKAAAPVAKCTRLGLGTTWQPKVSNNCAICAADEGAVALVDTPSSCEASPGPTKECGKRGGKQVRQQQAAKTLLALLDDMSQPNWDNGQGAAKQRLRGR